MICTVPEVKFYTRPGEHRVDNIAMGASQKITIITGTNRPGSNTYKLARAYQDYLNEEGVENHLLKLEDLPADFAVQALWYEKSEVLKAMIAEHLQSVEKFVFVIPEYNGGFPGVLKTFVDCIPPKVWHGKKAGLIGLSSGKAGALRPMDQFTNVLNYLQVSVLHAKPKLSEIEMILDEEGNVSDERAQGLLRRHAALMKAF